jgi:uncharacterized membrane protein
MAFCAKCGAKINEDAAFCGSCGNPVSSGSEAKPSPVSSPPSTKGSSMDSNVAAVLAYVLGFITGIIFLVLEPYKNDKFVRFHAFQSIFFSLALMVFWIVWNGIFWSILGRVVFLWAIMSVISMIVSLAALLLWLFLMYKAYNKEWFKIPIIGEFAAKQAG